MRQMLFCLLKPSRLPISSFEAVDDALQLGAHPAQHHGFPVLREGLAQARSVLPPPAAPPYPMMSASPRRPSVAGLQAGATASGRL